MIRITIISPAIAIRVGLRALLSEEPQINVVSEAANLANIYEPGIDTDVVVWAPAASADSTTVRDELSKLKPDETAALLLVYDDSKIMELLAHTPVRAWGMLDPEATQAELLSSIQALNEGLSVNNTVWLNQVIKNRSSKNTSVDDKAELLTGRELEILQLLALGLTNKQIAARLHISAHTVKFHVSTIFSKLGTTNRVESVNLGLKKGLIVL